MYYNIYSLYIFTLHLSYITCYYSSCMRCRFYDKGRCKKFIHHSFGYKKLEQNPPYVIEHSFHPYIIECRENPNLCGINASEFISALHY